MTATPETLLENIDEAPQQNDETTLGNSWLLGFDTETTGTSSQDAIVSASLVLRNPASGYEGDSISEWVINPHRPMNPAAGAVNGFTDEYLEAHGSEPQDALTQIAEAVRQAQAKNIPLLAYNAPFDVRMLRTDMEHWNLEPLPKALLTVDPLVIDRAVSKRSGKRNLAMTTAYYGVRPHGDFHDATADTVAAVDLIKPMTVLYPQVGALRLAELMTWQRQAYTSWRNSFNDWLASKGRRVIRDTWL